MTILAKSTASSIKASVWPSVLKVSLSAVECASECLNIASLLLPLLHSVINVKVPTWYQEVIASWNVPILNTQKMGSARIVIKIVNDALHLIPALDVVLHRNF